MTTTILEQMARAIERESWSMSAQIVAGHTITSQERSARFAKAALQPLLGELPDEIIQAAATAENWPFGYVADESPVFRAIVKAILEDQPTTTGEG